MDYGNYNVGYQQSYEIAQKKQEKKNKSSVLGTVAKVTGAAVGIGATILVGYGIINKGQGKKAAEKAKEGVQEVAAKGVNKVKDNVKKDQTQTIQKLLGNLQVGKTYKIEDAKQLKEALTTYKSNLALFKDIDTSDLTKNINDLISKLKNYIKENSAVELSDDSELITSKNSLATSITTIDNIITQSYENEPDKLDEVWEKADKLAIDVLDEDTIIEKPDTKEIPFDEDNKTLKDFSTDLIYVKNVSVEQKPDDSSLYLILDADDLKGFDIINKETFKYKFNVTDEEKDCFLFKLDSTLELEKIIKLIENDKIKNALIENDRESKYLQTYFENKAKEISQEDKLHDNKDLLNLIDLIDETPSNSELSDKILTAKTSLAINKLQYDNKDNLFDNFDAIKNLYEFENNNTYYVAKSGTFVNAEDEHLLKINVDAEGKVEITDVERGLTYNTQGQMKVEYSPLKHCIDLLNIENTNDEDLISSMQNNAIIALKELLSTIDETSLNRNTKKVLSQLKAANTVDAFNTIIKENPNALNVIKNNCVITKLFSDQDKFNNFISNSLTRIRDEKDETIQKYLSQIFNATSSSLVFRTLTGFNGKLKEDYDVKQKDKKEIIYTSNETPLKTYNVIYNDTDKKVEVNASGNKYIYNINSNKYEETAPTEDEKDKVDLFVFNSLSKDEKISFAKAQLRDIATNLTKSTIDKQKQTKLTSLITYLADNDPDCQKDASSKDNYENSISNMWKLMLNGKAQRGKKATFFRKSTLLDNKFYINNDGVLTQNEPTENNKYITVSVNTSSNNVKFKIITNKK